MKRLLKVIDVATVFVTVVLLLMSIEIPVSGGAQAPESSPTVNSVPAIHTPWGDPDLQGMWSSSALVTVPFERPRELGPRAVLTEDELTARNIAAATRVRPKTNPPTGWAESRPAPAQASLVTDPENGRLPPMTKEGVRRSHKWRTKAEPTYAYAGPEDLRPYDRCITRGVLGSTFPNIYSSAMWILQSPGFVVIHHEMIHETRVIPLDGRPYISTDIHQWLGDSRGRWEGDTLVVETKNFNGLTGSYARNGNGNPTSKFLKLIERFRLDDTNTLSYEVRVEDPQTWTRAWTVAFPLISDRSHVFFEYACHEANYALANILSGVRAAERRFKP